MGLFYFAVEDCHLINENIIAVDLRTHQECAGDPKFQSPILGVFTTSFAKLLLYEVVELLGKRVLYMGKKILGKATFIILVFVEVIPVYIYLYNFFFKNRYR